MKERRLFPYSTNQFIFLVFLIYYAQAFLGALLLMGQLSGLPPNPPSTLPWGIGRLMIHFYVWHLIPLLMVAQIVFNHFHWRNPFLRLEPFFHRVTTNAALIILAWLGYCLTTGGFYSYFTFLGYRVYNLGLLIYLVVALYLLRLFRHENILKTLIVVMLGVQIVSDLWELPLNLFWHHDAHILMYTLGTFQRLAVPLLFWFYTFRKNYSTTFRSRWFLMVPLMLLAAGLTLARLFFIEEGYPCFSVIMSLHIVYAFLLIFVPFHYYTKIGER